MPMPAGLPESDSKLTVDEADVDGEDSSRRSFKRARLVANLEREFQKLGIARDGYIHLLPQDGPDVSKRVWEKQAGVAREALRCTTLLHEEVLVLRVDRLQAWQGRCFSFRPCQLFQGCVNSLFTSSNCNAINTVWLVWLRVKYLHARPKDVAAIAEECLKLPPLAADPCNMVW